MRLKTSYTFQMLDFKKPIVTFYLIYFALLVVLFSIVPMAITSSDHSSTSSLSGMEFATSIFLMILILEGFKEHFYMLIQNGISRKSFFIGRIYSILTISFILSTFEFIFFYLYDKVTNYFVDNFIRISFYETIYTSRMGSDTLPNNLLQIIFHCSLFIAVMSGASLVATIYYHLSKSLRIIFCTGIPVLLFIVYPIVDYNLFQWSLSNKLADFFNFAFGLTANEPIRGIITFFLSSLLFILLSWVGMAKINIKD